MLKTNAGLYGCKILKQVQDDNIKYKKKYAATHSAEQKLCKRTINSGLFDKQFRNFKTNKCEDLN